MFADLDARESWRVVVSRGHRPPPAAHAPLTPEQGPVHEDNCQIGRLLRGLRPSMRSNLLSSNRDWITARGPAACMARQRAALDRSEGVRELILLVA